MGVFSSSIQPSFFQVEGALPSGFRDSFNRAIQDNAFRENDKARTKEEWFGWVNIADYSDTKFDTTKFVFHHLIALSMRVDKKRVPAKYQKIQIDKRLRETKESKGLERIGVSFKKEIKEGVEEDLLSRSLPIVSVHDMVWDTSNGRIYLFQASDIIRDFFAVLFRRTFSMDLLCLNSTSWLKESSDEEAFIEVLQSLEPVFDWNSI